MLSADQIRKLKYEVLKNFWGYEHFRPNQEEIIDSIIQGHDTLVLLPTGGGKSLCYQLPALITEGTCLVISPLLALMKDQVSQLKSRFIEAEYLSSELDDVESETILARCREGITKILYVSPERLTNSLFLENIEDIHVSFIAVDEAHCISEWGQDFRPSYQNISKFRSLHIQAPCIALTATATPKVFEEISKRLDLKRPKIFQESFRRKNITIIHEEISDKYQRVLDVLKFNKSAGIIYTSTRKEAENVTNFLLRHNVQNVDYFHAGLTPKEKNRKQTEFLQSNDKVLVSTNAFGMGIDKDNVRFIIHFSPSQSIESYYQEIGRAGRDGADSFALLLWNNFELKNFDDILKSQIPNKSEFVKIVTYLYSIFQVAETELPENVFQLQLQHLKNASKIPLAKITNVLHFLHNQEIIYYNNYKSLSSIESKIKAEDLDLVPKKEGYFLELLFRSISGLSSHRILFSETAIANKLGVDAQLLKDRIIDLQKAGLVDYIDGAQATLKFLKHRDERSITGKYWHLFEHIQKNKILKWEEMKYLLHDEDHCKMKMILSYFGERTTKNCGNCTVCQKKSQKIFGSNITGEIQGILRKGPATAEEISIQLQFFNKEEILENLILLLDAGKVKMLNFRTYILA